MAESVPRGDYLLMRQRREEIRYYISSGRAPVPSRKEPEPGPTSNTTGLSRNRQFYRDFV